MRLWSLPHRFGLGLYYGSHCIYGANIAWLIYLIPIEFVDENALDVPPSTVQVEVEAGQLCWIHDRRACWAGHCSNRRIYRKMIKVNVLQSILKWQVEEYGMTFSLKWHQFPVDGGHFFLHVLEIVRYFQTSTRYSKMQNYEKSYSLEELGWFDRRCSTRGVELDANLAGTGSEKWTANWSQ